MRDRFHHGDLPGTVVAAACDLIAERRVASFSLREVADAVGVSHAAVYRHFPGKADLMAEIATRGFRQLAEALKASAGGDAVASLHAMGLSYVRFGVEHPGTFRAMFLSELCEGNFPSLMEASQTAFMLLVEVVAQGQKNGGLRTDIAAEIAASSLWAAQHGYAVLLVDGQIHDGDQGHPDAVPGSLEALMSMLVKGLQAG